MTNKEIEYKISIPTSKGWAFIYLYGNKESLCNLDHFRYDPDTGEPEAIVLSGFNASWRIEFEDEIDIERVK